MAERLKSITDARKSLREISQTAQSRMDRYIITNQGQPQSVLMGYKEYQGMKATVELLNRPAEMARLESGLEQLDRGQRLTFDQVKQNLRRRRAEPEMAEDARMAKLYREEVLGEQAARGADHIEWANAHDIRESISSREAAAKAGAFRGPQPNKLNLARIGRKANA